MDKLNCILLIDDDEVNNFVSASNITLAGIANTTKECLSGQEALDWLLQQQAAGDEHLPDAIFLDIRMPGMSGWEFLDSLRALRQSGKFSSRKRMVIAMLTSSSYPDDITRSKRYKEVSSYISKPLGLDKIAQFHQEFFSDNA
jgi:CheY-like chemotaxis protein